MHLFLQQYSSLLLFFLGLVYAIITCIGLLSLKNHNEPISDPWFTSMELLIIIMSPLMVVFVIQIYEISSKNSKIYSISAICFMCITVCITSCLHFIILSFPLQERNNHDWFFAFKWPSVIYALDILAWDLFFGLSMIFGSLSLIGNPKFNHIRYLMLISGVLSLFGLLGPVFHNMMIRNIGIIGYGIVFPIVSLALSGSIHSALAESKAE